jgi:hypothetical protein
LDETKTNRLIGHTKLNFHETRPRVGFFVLGEWPLLAGSRHPGSRNHGSPSGGFRPKADIRIPGVDDTACPQMDRCMIEVAVLLRSKAWSVE